MPDLGIWDGGVSDHYSDGGSQLTVCDIESARFTRARCFGASVVAFRKGLLCGSRVIHMKPQVAVV